MPSLCPLTPCTTGVRPHLWASQSLSLAETVTGSGSLEGVSSGRMYLGNATTTTPVSLVLIQEKTLCRRRKGEEGPGECSGRPEARVLSATASESSGSTPLTMSPGPRPAGCPRWKQRSFSRPSCYLWFAVQTTEEQGDTFSCQGSRGKDREKKCQHLDINGNGKISTIKKKKIKRDRKYILVIMELELAEAG